MPPPPLPPSEPGSSPPPVPSSPPPADGPLLSLAPAGPPPFPVASRRAPPPTATIKPRTVAIIAAVIAVAIIGALLPQGSGGNGDGKSSKVEAVDPPPARPQTTSQPESPTVKPSTTTSSHILTRLEFRRKLETVKDRIWIKMADLIETFGNPDKTERGDVEVGQSIRDQLYLTYVCADGRVVLTIDGNQDLHDLKDMGGHFLRAVEDFPQ